MARHWEAAMHNRPAERRELRRILLTGASVQMLAPRDPAS